jgi:hypothetical protein
VVESLLQLLTAPEKSMGFLKKIFGKKKKKNKAPTPDTMNPGMENVGRSHKDAYMPSVLDAHGKEKKKKKKSKPMKDKDVKSSRALGGGSANDVTVMNYKKEIGNTGTKKGYFKSDYTPGKDHSGNDTFMPGEGMGIGIDDKDARNSARAVTSGRVDEFFGAIVVSRDQFAKHNGSAGVISPDVGGVSLKDIMYNDNASDGISVNDAKDMNAMQGGRFKISDGEAFESKGSEYRDIDHHDANIQHGMANLQVMDFLSGQIDRHGGNIKVDPTTGRVTGIDNDLAWGKDHQVVSDFSGNARGIGQTQVDKTQKFDEEDPLKAALPQQIDAELGMRILHSDEDDYAELLKGEKGDLTHLNEEEIDAALYRYRRLKAHVDDLYMNDGFIWDWSSEEVHDEVMDGSNYMSNHKALVDSSNDDYGSMHARVKKDRTPNRKIA